MKRLWSVFTDDMDHCMFTCTAPVELQHVFGATKKRKLLSEQYGFIAPLRPDLHPNGAQAGKDAKNIDTLLKQRCQQYYEKHYGTREQFRKEFGKSYF